MKKKGIQALLTAAVVAVIGVGATLAYLNDTTTTATNVFTSNKAISIQLREDTWDGWTFSDPDSAQIDGMHAKTDSATLGINMASAYVPGTTIPKNPTVKNDGTTATGVPVYTALKVQYFSSQDAAAGTEMTYEEFKAAYLATAGIAFSGDWTILPAADGEKFQIFKYAKDSDILAVNETTTPLFAQVPLSLNLAPSEEGSGLLPKFSIKVTAYAIQSDNVPPAEVDSTLGNFVRGIN